MRFIYVSCCSLFSFVYTTILKLRSFIGRQQIKLLFKVSHSRRSVEHKSNSQPDNKTGEAQTINNFVLVNRRVETVHTSRTVKRLNRQKISRMKFEKLETLNCIIFQSVLCSSFSSQRKWLIQCATSMFILTIIITPYQASSHPGRTTKFELRRYKFQSFMAIFIFHVNLSLRLSYLTLCLSWTRDDLRKENTKKETEN